LHIHLRALRLPTDAFWNERQQKQKP